MLLFLSLALAKYSACFLVDTRERQTRVYCAAPVSPAAAASTRSLSAACSTPHTRGPRRGLLQDTWRSNSRSQASFPASSAFLAASFNSASSATPAETEHSPTCPEKKEVTPHCASTAPGAASPSGEAPYVQRGGVHAEPSRLSERAPQSPDDLECVEIDASLEGVSREGLLQLLRDVQQRLPEMYKHLAAGLPSDLATVSTEQLRMLLEQLLDFAEVADAGGPDNAEESPAVAEAETYCPKEPEVCQLLALTLPSKSASPAGDEAQSDPRGAAAEAPNGRIRHSDAAFAAWRRLLQQPENAAPGEPPLTEAEVAALSDEEVKLRYTQALQKARSDGIRATLRRCEHGDSAGPPLLDCKVQPSREDAGDLKSDSSAFRRDHRLPPAGLETPPRQEQPHRQSPQQHSLERRESPVHSVQTEALPAGGAAAPARRDTTAEGLQVEGAAQGENASTDSSKSHPAQPTAKASSPAVLVSTNAGGADVGSSPLPETATAHSEHGSPEEFKEAILATPLASPEPPAAPQSSSQATPGNSAPASRRPPDDHPGPPSRFAALGLSRSRRGEGGFKVADSTDLRWTAWWLCAPRQEAAKRWLTCCRSCRC
ncbi:hypothetical protein cyc_03008 [Cyclospora cayetanensis]|uniref:Uncharacterized protein n=1 Tax=Cyclospora cayetanensis TaxID=88456 RepID=A0A1D3D5R7_9EIME|nr:hypothetical protein cyc_03008 [Cyclospora cayetanensis]